MYTEHRKDRKLAELAKAGEGGDNPKLSKKAEALKSMRVDAVATTPSILEGRISPVLVRDDVSGGLDNPVFEGDFIPTPTPETVSKKQTH